MSVGLCVRYDRGLRELAAGMFDRGVGFRTVARELGVPDEAVRQWSYTYRAVGRERLMDMGGGRAAYGFDTRVAAARAVVEDGATKSEAMERFAVASRSSLDRWCRLYRAGGEEALRPGRRGRPRGSGARGPAATREQELEERVRRLEAQVAYLKRGFCCFRGLEDGCWQVDGWS